MTECCVCGELMDHEPEYCCSGHMCGCYGMPIEPPVCSGVCWDQLMKPKVKQ